MQPSGVEISSQNDHYKNPGFKIEKKKNYCKQMFTAFQKKKKKVYYSCVASYCPLSVNGSLGTDKDILQV